MPFNSYSDENPPKYGTSKKIYDAFKTRNWIVHELHYNANCWGRGQLGGWGTWACSITDDDGFIECWCGWYDGRAYLQGCTAPFWVVRI